MKTYRLNQFTKNTPEDMELIQKTCDKEDLEFIEKPTLEEVIESDKKARAYVIQCVKGA